MMASVTTGGGVDDAFDLHILRLLASDDEREAHAAFTQLWKATEGYLNRVLRRFGVDPHRGEDYRQEIAVRMWNAREAFQASGKAQWYGYVRRVAHSVVIDGIRKNHPPIVDVESLGEIPDSESPHVEAFIEARENRTHFYELADECWLKVSSDHAANRKRLLAAQLYYLEGRDPKSIAEIVLAGRTRGAETIEAWLTDPSVLRHLAYQQLYWSNERLSGYLLCPHKPLDSSELDRAQSIERVKSHWAEDEVLLVLLRYRNGLLTEQIERFKGCTLDQPALETFYERCRERLPMAALAKELARALAKTRSLAHIEHDDVWKRIVFEYFYAEDLARKQIIERTDPPAQVLGTSIDETRLNGWISMRRLLNAFMSFLKRRGSIDV